MHNLALSLLTVMGFTKINTIKKCRCLLSDEPLSLA